MAKKITSKKIKRQNEIQQLLESSELVHQYLVEHPHPDFDIPDFLYVPWLAAIKNLGGNV